MIQLPTLHLGRGTQAGPLTVFPIWTDAPVAAHRPYTLTLRGNGAVTELEDDPSVAHLVVTQPGPKPLLLLEGQMLAGGQQHRVLTYDVLVDANRPRQLDVRCVEAGRWGGGETRQSLDGTSAPLAVRGALRGIRQDRTVSPEEARDLNRADQGDVWRRVASYERRYGASNTNSLVDVQRRQRQNVNAAVRGIQPLFGQRGVLIGVNGEPVLLEVFDHPRTLVQLLGSIVKGVALDALDLDRAPTSTTRARQFVERVQRGQLEAVIREERYTNRVAGDGLYQMQSLNTRQGIVHAAALNVRHELVLAV